MDDFFFNFFPWFLGSLFAVLLFMLFVVLPIQAVHENNLNNQLNSGQITLGQYCDAMTNDGTESNNIPVKCYEYYNVQRVGTHCHFVGKVDQCDPVLAPTNNL